MCIVLILAACSTSGGGALRGGGNSGDVRAGDGGAGATPANTGEGARATNSGTGFSEGEAEGGGGESLMGGPGTQYDEQDTWSVVPFLDPRTGQTYDIIDGRVLVAFKNPPPVPQVDPNYFDVERSPNDMAYSIPYPPVVTDPVIAAFIAAENLTVVSEWLCIKSIGALLPEGQTVLDAVVNWPVEYSSIIEQVDPDALGTPHTTPPNPPSDERFVAPGTGYADPTEGQWAINGTSTNGDIHIREVWDADEQNGSAYTNPVIAILDTGVDYDAVINGVNTLNQDLVPNSTLKGCNVGDSKASTQFLNRTDEGGEPWEWIKDISSSNASLAGHGTSVAGVTSAAINNDSGHTQDSRDISGVAFKPKYFPVAMKFRAPYSSTTFSVVNAYIAVGCVQGCIDKAKEYGASFYVPHYQIEVVNCSFGFPTISGAERRTLDRVNPFMLFVCAAGKSAGVQSDYPAKYTGCVSVGGYLESGAWFYRNCPDINIAGPSSGVYSTDMLGTNSHGQQLGLSNQPNCMFAGTSIACPHVAAVALLTACKYPSLSAAQLKSRLISKSVQSLTGGPTGVGRVDAWRCLYEP